MKYAHLRFLSCLLVFYLLLSLTPTIAEPSIQIKCDQSKVRLESESSVQPKGETVPTQSDSWRNPLVKQGRLGSPLVEVTPFVFNDSLYLLENWQKYWDVPGANPEEYFHEDQVRIRDVAEDKIVSVALRNHAFATALVWNGQVYVFAGYYGKDKPWRHITEIIMTSSEDLVHWKEPVTVVRVEQGERLFNTAVCRGKDSFILLYETDDKKWPAFTFKYCQSDDLINWTHIPDAIYGRNKYVGGPALYYERGWYYTLYLQALGNGKFETRITRSGDLRRWQDAPQHRPFVTFNSSHTNIPLHDPMLCESNASDAELCYFKNQTIVYFTGGDQSKCGDLQWATYEGTPRELFECFFDQASGSDIVSPVHAGEGTHQDSHKLEVSMTKWLGPQQWERDTSGPIISLGETGQFDDTHIFAPCVAYEKDRYLLWYCGSSGNVAQRMFSLGLAMSVNGRDFEKYEANPVFGFGDGKHSVLTPTILRRPDGSVLREDNKLRMWFSAARLGNNKHPHTLHETTSADGICWSKPSEAQLENVYAPTVIKENDHYRMWFTDVSCEPWVFRHAKSCDGKNWRITLESVLRVDQDWELSNLFYPTVSKIDDVFLMWYGSYCAANPQKTSIGFAVSMDGLCWHKHPQNPVLRPDPNRSWESHYTTSQSVMQLEDGSWRIWYASRKKPPFLNKYFAINTAKWSGPATDGRTDPSKDYKAFTAWQQQLRAKLWDMLGIPRKRIPLKAEPRGQIEHDGIVIEKWVFTSEPGSRVPAVLYRPMIPKKPMPAVVLTFGHGGSKSQPSYMYMAQMFAKMGLACLAIDPIGEEERNLENRMGTRAHDPEPVHRRAWDANRPIMGKLVWDTMRGVDFLLERSDIDSERIGVAGNSLGGAKAGWMAVLDMRLRFAIVSGWAFSDTLTKYGKFCTRVPNKHARQLCSWDEYLSLAAPHCAILVMNGDADVIIDRDKTGRCWSDTREAVEKVAVIYSKLGAPGNIKCWFEPDGGHRPYPAYPAGLEWIIRHAHPEGWVIERVRDLGTINFGSWADTHSIEFEKLYGTDLRRRGATLADMRIQPIWREQLACLRPDEIGKAEYTLEGWLNQIEKNAAIKQR